VHSVKVQLQQSADGMLVSDALSSASAVTDAAGRFVLLGVSPGSYVLNAVRLTPGAESEDAADAMTLWASAPVSVGEQDVRGLAIALQPGTRILGQVDFGAVSTSPLVEGLRVNLNLRPFGGGAGTYRGAFTNVRADGSFALLGMPPGRYQISASIGCPSRNPCPNEWQLQAVTLGGTLLPYDVVDVADADLSGLVLHFSERSAAVSGSIVDANGSPSAADAIIFPADTNLWQYDVVNRRVRVEHARPDGGFWIDRLGPGDYYVVAVDPPFPYMDPVAFERLVPGATRITLGEGEQTTVRLETYTPGGSREAARLRSEDENEGKRGGGS